MEKPKIQCIILNYNNCQDTLVCLDFLRKQSWKNLDILTIDNGSMNNSAEEIRRHHPGSEIIESPKNLGFAGGCNLGIKTSIERKPDYFFFLNNDALVESDTLSLLVKTGQNNPHIGMLGPLIFTSLPGFIIESLGMKCNWKTGRFYHRLHGKPQTQIRPDLRSRTSIEVDALSGCALLVKRKVMEKIGGFDEDYFFYFEDADLCRRAQKAGFQTVLVPAATVEHKGSSTITDLDPALRIYYGVRNQLLLFNRNEPYQNPVLRLLRDSYIISLNFLYIFFHSRLPKIQASKLWGQGISDYYRGKLGKY
ncbi:MAG: glycosyltransferase family 2 protein [Proteobacteria bacterium]|nr:glycosyltransferase family 2 protein [Pseudomonadota bacterium]